MDPTVRKVVEMLSSPAPDLAPAAARVLAELRPKEAEAVDALARALAAPDFDLRRLALEALGATGASARRAAASIAALLEDGGGLSVRAEEILAGMGPAVLPALQKLLAEASPKLRKPLTLAIARIPAPVDADRLVSCLEQNDARLIDAACLTLENQAHELDPAVRKRLVGRLGSYLDKPGHESDLSAFSAALRMLGALDHASAVEALFPWAGPDHGPWVRSSALRALKNLASHLDPDRHLATILGYLADTVDERIVGPAIEILYPLPFGKTASRRLEGLTESPHPAVRKLAMEKLEGLNPKWLVPRLLALLDKDPASREKATEILGRIPGGAAAAVKALETAASPDRVRALGCVLAARPAEANEAVWEKLIGRALGLDEESRGLAEAFAGIAKSLAPEAFCRMCLAEAIRFKRAKRHTEAARTLRWAKGIACFDSEARFLLAACELQTSRKDLSKASRLTDPCLSVFQGLAHDKDFSLLDRIRKEKPAFDPEALFYLGFHFSEGAGPETALGEELLAGLAKKSPGSKLGKAARNKLKAQGLASSRGPDLDD